MVDEKRIWINGANTPWINWNEFGGNMSTANWNSWSAEFDRLKSNGINATRIWVNCSGESGSITLDNNGNVTAVSQIHWDNLEKLFDLAAEKKIYILATITSFDHFKAGTPAARWKIMIQDQSKSQTFIDKYTIPFCQKFKDNPYLWSIDIMNEPDWVWEESWGGISWNHISRFLAMNAAAIHENSEILVTVGMAYAKWQIGNNNPTGSSHAQEGNKVSDQYLQGLYNNQKAYLDFWSPHYYAWNAEWFGVTHYLTPYGNRSGNSTNGYSGGLGINSDANNPVKPAIIGECSAKGTVNQVDPDHGNYNYERSYIAASLRPNPDNSITTDYEHAFNNGWQGVMPWTSNGVDANGGLSNTQLGTATKNMESKYPTLIYPLGK